MKNGNSQSKVLVHLFFRLLPVQVLIVAMGSINSIVDGVVAARGIDAATIGVIGLYFSMVRIFEAVGSVFLGGTAVLCGRYLGRGDTQKIKGMFSLNMTVTFLAGVILTFANTVMADGMAVIMGAEGELMTDALVTYSRGYAIGIIPMLLAAQMAAFLQLEHNTVTNYIGSILMIVLNVVLDLLFVYQMDMGLWGLALATSVCNWAYFLVLLTHFFKKGTVFKYRVSAILWNQFAEMIVIGFPGAILVICLAARYVVINRLLIRYGGEGGLPALSAFNMITGLFIALGLGTGAVVRMLTSVFIGEEDREAIAEVFKIVYTRLMALSVALGVLVLIFSGMLAGIFFPDHGTEAFRETKTLFAMYSICIPLVMICSVSSNYFQALKRNVFVNVVSVFDGFVGMVVPAVILAPIFGATGVSIALVLGIAMTASLGFIYSIICNRKIPRSIPEWLLLDQEFGPDENPRLSVTIREIGEVASVSEKVQRFCLEHGLPERQAMNVALCLEETAGNIVDHGFKAGKGSHTVDIRVLMKEDGTYTTVRDDCIPFDPVEWAKITSGEDPAANIGIRMVLKIATDVSYQNLLGMNVLSMNVRTGA